jgi:hypothetical protein
MDDTEILKKIESGDIAASDIREMVELAKRIVSIFDDNQRNGSDDAWYDSQDDFLLHNTLTVSQVAERTGRDPATIRRWCVEMGIGKQSGRGRNWLVSIPRLNRELRPQRRRR